ncbi:MAG: leucyl aminopeptidase [Bacillaceae bacterium]|nr:leucyl aminopeptidase [Bacillaceae bacterium]
MFTVYSLNQWNTPADALVIGLYKGSRDQQFFYSDLNEQMKGFLEECVQDGDISDDYKKVSVVHTLKLVKPKRLYVVGLGHKKHMTLQKLRKAFGTLFKQIQEDGRTDISIALDSFKTDQAEEAPMAEVLAEAQQLATYRLADYKTSNRKSESHIEHIRVLTEKPADQIESSLQIGKAFGTGANTARHLVHMPGNMLTATELANFAKELAEKYDFDIEILEKEDMERLGMGALLAVNQGSVEPPKMIVLKYQGTEKWENAVGLVGKGITFDTGGYSIKTKDGIVGMKTDMGGAASVLGAMETIGILKPKKNVVAVIPSTDNMISGSAFKPDDVITSFGGKTIEVRNTDAEGRLALADAIVYAKHHRAETIIDVATLTGGVVVALGDWVTGSMTNNDELYNKVKQASQYTDEPIWQLPYLDVYQEQVRKSDIADLNNSPGRKAHPIMAGAFLGEFAEDTPWVHLDIAGTAVSEQPYDLGPKGPTGVMARTLARFVLETDE